MRLESLPVGSLAVEVVAEDQHLDLLHDFLLALVAAHYAQAYRRRRSEAVLGTSVSQAKELVVG